jgi:hypothetical protein
VPSWTRCLSETLGAPVVGVIATRRQGGDELLGGLKPGSLLAPRQKRPAYVLRVGQTDLAIDGRVARELYVRQVACRAISHQLSAVSGLR